MRILLCALLCQRPAGCSEAVSCSLPSVWHLQCTKLCIFLFLWASMEHSVQGFGIHSSLVLICLFALHSS